MPRPRAGRPGSFWSGCGRRGRLLADLRAPARQPKLNAYLEDYAFLIDALVSLYEATFEVRWVKAAVELADVMIEEFCDPAGGFFFTGRGHERLIARTKDPHDSSIPSGNSMAVTGLLRLAKLTGRPDFRDKAETTLQLFRGLMASSPTAAGQMLLALDFHLGPTPEYALVGDPGNPDVGKVLALIRSGFRPNKVLALRTPQGAAEPTETLLPLLKGKTAQGPVTTYVCQDFTCQAPLVGVEAVEQALAKGERET